LSLYKTYIDVIHYRLEESEALHREKEREGEGEDIDGISEEEKVRDFKN
jgi:hypothetical protein